MKAHDAYISREKHFVLGFDSDSEKYYLAFPVTIGVVDYDEYYELDESTYHAWLADPDLALPFLAEARNREHDELLIQKPGWNRGIPY